MGTRGSTGIIYQEKVFLGYNHFDSYPSALGQEMVNLILDISEENGWEKFRENASKLKELKQDDTPTKELIEKYKKYADLSVSNKSLEDLYCLFREIQGADWVREVYEGNLEHYPTSNFIMDSLFCEFAYIINLDTMKLEFYDGFQKTPQKGNRFGDKPNGDGYYPCRLVGVFNLFNINESLVDKTIVDRMEEICESKKDDISVLQYFRKPKLDNINEKVCE